jgi:ABC-2 type transport system ATP-binding protein
MNESIIYTRDLTRRFGNITAVNQLNLEIKKGEIFGFLGPNGAGKSTTIRMLCGILLPTSGNAWVNGYDVMTQPDEIKKTIGYMSQQFGLYNDLTVEENIEFFARIYLSTYKEAVNARERIIELLELGKYRKALTSTLSGGWKQRLALACAVVHNPQIIFLDEPTAGIDPVARRKLWDILYRFSEQGVTLFVTTHYMEEAERCHKIGFIWNGNLVACDSPHKVKMQLKGEKILSIKGSPLMKIMEIARSFSKVMDVNIYGDEVHAVFKVEEPEEDFIAELKNSGVDVEYFKRITPSIEDVFVALSRE